MYTKSTSIYVSTSQAAQAKEFTSKGVTITHDIDGNIYIVGHNALNPVTGVTRLECAAAFRKAIEEAGPTAKLLTCCPARLPEDLRGYTLDPNSDKEWALRTPDIKGCWVGEGPTVEVVFYETRDEITPDTFKEGLSNWAKWVEDMPLEMFIFFYPILEHIRVDKDGDGYLNGTRISWTGYWENLYPGRWWKTQQRIGGVYIDTLEEALIKCNFKI
jgi:hypothetical protein